MKYKNLCTAPLNRKLRKLFWAGGTNGWSNAGRITFVALSFTLGNIITVKQLGVEWHKVMLSTGILFFSLMSIGGAS